MVLESQVLALSPPSDRVLGNFRRWFTSTSVPVLWDRDEHIFDNARDLVALAPPDTDRLNLFLQKYFGWLFKVYMFAWKSFQHHHSVANGSSDIMIQETRGKDDVEHERSKDVFYTPQRRIQRAGAIISVLFSAILLVGAMVSLLLLQDQSSGLRVGLIVLFTCLFAFVVGLLTNARRAEIFGSTAA